MLQLHGAVAKDPKIVYWYGRDPEGDGIINQKGLNRKVRLNGDVRLR